jgi:membrane protein
MTFFSLLSEASTRWREDKVPQLAAATAYYAIFSLAPLLVVIIALLGFFFDTSSARTVVLDQISGLLGKQGADGIATMIDAARLSTNSGFALSIGIGTLVLGATGVMIALQDAANFIWKVTTKKTANSIVMAVLKRIFSLAFILGIGFLLLISLVVSAALTAFSLYLERFGAVASALPALNLLLSFVVFFVLFAMLLKYIPDVLLAWRDVLPGAALTALLFVIGKSVLGWYLGQKDAVSAYGVAGSLIIVLLWINYTSQIFFFGIEFTKACTLRRTGSVCPREYAELTNPLSVHRK